MKGPKKQLIPCVHKVSDKLRGWQDVPASMVHFLHRTNSAVLAGT